ncbi:MAG: hypothetical protein ACD_19C00426G0130 [uncultured bacterium]|nr:MAG: hypothetical protein ACD_19C00426G0130 [uncultured bacterium]
MIKLDDKYEQLPFLELLKDLLPDFEKDVRKIDVASFKVFESGNYLGKSKKLDLQVFEVKHQSSNTARVAIATDGFRLMKQSAVYRAIIVFRTENSEDWRLSLMTLTPERNETGGVSVQVSNPRRYSYLLGQKAKINTPTKFLLSKGKIADFEDLKNRFSIEVVNKEFYNEISKAFTSLVSGKLKLPDRVDFGKENLEFAVRMIGRIIFCWFLREKISDTGKSLMPKDLLSLEAVISNKDYYHKILEPIFFEVLNKPAKSRNPDFAESPFSSIPYLNGGLFSPQDDDFYKRTKDDFQSQYHNTLIIPDEWFKDFFEILETYNFTIDENTSYDEELSIDPEMLGRIFENLLAEINPETGESARKSTGSYYTPRVIVNYMVDESLLLYLKNKTNIDEGKLKAIISYDLSDDTTNPIGNDEKEKIIDALEKVKILDPACGSGAFPMGALQKIVFILQQTDPDGQLWFKKQMGTATPEFRRDIEKKFSNNELDFIRKLGVIRNSIYGIDIQPIATEISRLRCFLTLIVDEVIKDGEENRGVKPLPNLDFKFVTANSLIGLPKIEDGPQQLLFDEKENVEKLRKLMDEFFSADEQGKYMLMNTFHQIQKELIKQYFREKDYSAHEQKKILSSLGDWDPFSHQGTDWFDPEWMFGIKNGFDIVLGNPPYVRISSISEDEDILIRSSYSAVFGHYDLYIPFFEKGIKLLNSTGILTYITPNKYLIKRYGNKLRPFILDNTHIAELIDTSKARTFDGVSVYPVISILTKSIINEQIRVCVLDDSTFLPYFETKNISYCYQINQDSFLENKNKIFDIYIDDDSRGLFDKISTKTKPLSQFARVLTGTPAINKYYEWDKLLFDGVKQSKTDLSDNQTVLKFINVSNLKPYFIEWGKEIRAVGNRLCNPYLTFDKELIGIKKWEVFQKSKIVIKGNSKRLTAAYDAIGYANLSLYAVIFNENHNDIDRTNYYLALLNSELLNYWYCKKFGSGNIAGGYISFNGIYLEQIPIVEFGNKTTIDISKKVKEVIEITNDQNYLNDEHKQLLVNKLTKQIDQMVYKLYDLTTEEIEIVENG